MRGAEIGVETLCGRPYWGRKWNSIWGTTGACRHGRGTACERPRWGMQREGGGRKESDERRSKEKARTQQNKRVERNMFWIDIGSLEPFFEGS